MARKKRIWYPGAIYHVISRGTRKAEIFKDHNDYIRFLEYLEKVRKMYPFDIHTLCLMTNHFHMLVETQDFDLSLIMQKFLSQYAQSFNLKYNYTGHLFESRYTASIIEDESYFLEVSRYIHLNPVRANMVNEPQAYDYSSYRLFAADSNDTEPDKFLELLSDMIDTDKALQKFNLAPDQYRKFVENPPDGVRPPLQK